jgi:hypothetical protein
MSIQADMQNERSRMEALVTVLTDGNDYRRLPLLMMFRMKMNRLMKSR